MLTMSQVPFDASNNSFLRVGSNSVQLQNDGLEVKHAEWENIYGISFCSRICLELSNQEGAQPPLPFNDNDVQDDGKCLVHGTR